MITSDNVTNQFGGHLFNAYDFIFVSVQNKIEFNLPDVYELNDWFDKYKGR